MLWNVFCFEFSYETKNKDKERLAGFTRLYGYCERTETNQGDRSTQERMVIFCYRECSNDI